MNIDNSIIRGVVLENAFNSIINEASEDNKNSSNNSDIQSQYEKELKKQFRDYKDVLSKVKFKVSSEGDTISIKIYDLDVAASYTEEKYDRVSCGMDVVEDRVRGAINDINKNNGYKFTKKDQDGSEWIIFEWNKNKKSDNPIKKFFK